MRQLCVHSVLSSRSSGSPIRQQLPAEVCSQELLVIINSQDNYLETLTYPPAHLAAMLRIIMSTSCASQTWSWRSEEVRL